jgi:hypothetical protein
MLQAVEVSLLVARAAEPALVATIEGIRGTIELR